MRPYRFRGARHGSVNILASLYYNTYITYKEYIFILRKGGGYGTI